MSLVLKEIRKKYNLSQTAFAQRLGVSRSAIAQIESGKNNISMPMAKNIASVFNVSLDGIINDNHDTIANELYSGKNDFILKFSTSIYYRMTDVNLTIDQIEITKLAIKQFCEDKGLNPNVSLEILKNRSKANEYDLMLIEYQNREKNKSIDEKFLNEFLHLCTIMKNFGIEELYKLVTINYGTLKKYYDNDN